MWNRCLLDVYHPELYQEQEAVKEANLVKIEQSNHYVVYYVQLCVYLFNVKKEEYDTIRCTIKTLLIGIKAII